jgi:hypothetical protein
MEKRLRSNFVLFLQRTRCRYRDHRRLGDAGAFFNAEMYAQLGDSAEALRWLKVAERLRDPNLIYTKVYRMLDPIRERPEFKALLARLDFPD